MSAAMLFVAAAALGVAFHLAMIAGAPWGHLTMGGRWDGRLPVAGRLAAAASAVLMAAMAVVVADLGGLIRIGAPRWTGWVVVGVMTLSVAMNAVTPSAGERRLWLPVAVLMAASVVWVMFSGSAVDAVVVE